MSRESDEANRFDVSERYFERPSEEPEPAEDVNERQHAGRASAAASLVDLAGVAELFHTSAEEAFATFPVGDHRETASLRSRRFRSWLVARYHREHRGVPTSSAFADARAVLEGIALHDGPRHEVFTRLARVGDTIVLDLANANWEAVVVDRDGWSISAEAPVRFRRPGGMLALPAPSPGGTLDDLRPFVNMADGDWVLFVSWLVACFRPQGPYPILNLLGEQGAAKSTVARVVRELVDPNEAPLRSSPSGPRDLMIAATNGWVVAFDNLSHVSSLLSDALCRLSTGGGFATRELYTDTEEVILDAQRPCVVTGITELDTRADLLDRSLLITLPNIRPEERRSERDFWGRFEEVRPLILGALLNAVSFALGHERAGELRTLPRMADFAAWSFAAAPALGWPGDVFLDKYEQSRGAIHEIALDDSPIGAPLLELGRDGFRGSATELLQRLCDHVGEETRKEQGWPKTPRALSGALRRLAPNLRALGVELAFGRETIGEKRRLIALAPVPPLVTPVTSVTRSSSGGGGDELVEPAGIPGDAGDASDGASTRRAPEE